MLASCQRSLIRSMSPGRNAGGTRQELQLDITREQPVDDNAFQATGSAHRGQYQTSTVKKAPMVAYTSVWRESHARRFVHPQERHICNQVLLQAS